MTIAQEIAALTPRFDITLEDRLNYKSSSWAMVRRRGEYLDFEDPRTGELLTLTDEELAGLIGLGEARIVRGNASEKEQAYAAATADLGMLPNAVVEDGRRAIAYTDELKARGLTYRPAEAKVKEAIAHVAARIFDPQPPAPYLVKRWQKRGDGRAAGGGRTADETTLADYVPQHSFKGNRSSRVSFEVSKIIHAAIQEVYLTLERRSVDSVISVSRNRVRLSNEERDPEDQLTLPGRKAVENAIASLPRGEVIRRRYGADKAYDAVGPVEYRSRPEEPLDEIEMDHTTCDLFVVDSLTGAPLGRPTVVIGADRCTAMPWGAHVGFDPPSVHTVMQCMRNGMLTKNYVRMYADAGIWDIKGSWPVFGRPKKLSVDRGAENINHDMRALAVDLPIKEIEAKAGRKGRLKGGIERFLGTLNRTLLQEQRGTTFSNVVARDDYDPKKNAVITYEELLEKIHQWLIDVYIRRYHHGIKDVPLRRWNQKIANYRPRQVENIDKLLPLFGRIEHRVLRRDGIRWKHLFFTSPEVMGLLSNPDFLKASTNPRGDVVVRFRYDPSNVDHIHVYLPHARGQETMHLRVSVERRAREYARGLSVWAHTSIVKMMRDDAMGTIDFAALDAAKSKLIADLDRDTPGSTRVRSMVRIARIRQIGGIAPYGDSVRTTPEGSFEDRRQQVAVETSISVPKSHSSLTAGSGGLPFPSEFEPDEDDIDFAARTMPKPVAATPKYKRGDDPAAVLNQKRAKPGGRGRRATPKIIMPATGDEIDFYNDEVRA
ncbi:MAG: transposase [Sphingomonas bacterium]|uniref:Mu transposase C-terminal domain-containing protein n=1 Tax=Sphingomonas bacterium TaxID=1895847 RepID=UPI0026323EA6|nr:Mu transposase C-terminal domain-containing protein [Sphingomonas bacterium]MDB5710360.1 transposase [Sphingomonas bacterium]